MYVCVGSKMESVWEKEEGMGGRYGWEKGGGYIWWGKGGGYEGEKGEGVHVCLAHIKGLDGYPPDDTCMLNLRLDLHMFLLSSEASCMYMYIVVL